VTHLKLNTILWPTDFSPLSLAGADVARELVQLGSGRLHVIHVAPLLVSDPTISRETGGDLLVSTIDLRTPAEAAMQRLQRDYFGPGLKPTHEIAVGVAWREICDCAGRIQADLIVLATHGASGLKHVLIGSVAERVVQHAPCPVLVVKNFPLASVS
jgi:nucleotide-binding universal stress UspA family protein